MSGPRLAQRLMPATISRARPANKRQPQPPPLEEVEVSPVTSANEHKQKNYQNTGTASMGKATGGTSWGSDREPKPIDVGKTGMRLSTGACQLPTVGKTRQDTRQDTRRNADKPPSSNGNRYQHGRHAGSKGSKQRIRGRHRLAADGGGDSLPASSRRGRHGRPARCELGRVPRLHRRPQALTRAMD